MPSSLTDKLFYKIGEVAETAEVRTSVLRFWESEFPFLKPQKSNSGQRLYTKHELDLVMQVKHLLYDEKFTIEGVKQRLNTRGKLVDSPEILSNCHADTSAKLLKIVREELKVLRNLL